MAGLRQPRRGPEDRLGEGGVSALPWTVAQAFCGSEPAHGERACSPPGPVSACADSQSRPGHRGSGPGWKHSVQEPEEERQGEGGSSRQEAWGGGAEGQRAPRSTHVRGRADGQVCQTWME